MSKLITESGNVHPALIGLAGKTGLQISDSFTPEGVNSILQLHWRQKGTLALDITGDKPDAKDFELLAELGLVSEVHAPKDGRPYDCGVLLGGALFRVRTRLASLVNEFERGNHFRQVYLLGNERPLKPEKGETQTALQFPSEGLNIKQAWKPEEQILPTNEMEMIEFVVAQSDIPREWEIIPILTPNIPLKSGGARLADTGDTLVQWQKQSALTEGRFLLASNNPFIAYQETNARRVLCHNKGLTGMEFVGIGDAARTTLPLATFLDTIAKLLYEETQLRLSR